MQNKPNTNEREYPQRPIVAVSGVVLNSKKEILLVRRANPPGQGLWSLPGGAVKLGEKLTHALKREIQEECNIAIKVIKLLGAFDRIFFDKNDRIQYHYIILDYLCITAEMHIKPASDVDHFVWISKQNLNNYQYTPGVKDMLVDGFKRGWK